MPRQRNKIRKRLVETLVAAGWSRAEISEAIGVSRYNLAQWSRKNGIALPFENGQELGGAPRKYDYEAIRADWLHGEPIAVIQGRHGIKSPKHVGHIVRVLGLPLRNVRLTDVLLKAICKDYHNGRTWKEIAQRNGIPEARVGKALRKGGIKPNRKAYHR